MTNIQKETLYSKYVNILLVVSGYWIVSISTVFVNKTLLSDIKLDAPIFITACQTFITVLICLLKKLLSKLYPNRFKFPDIDVLSWSTIKDVVPLSIMFTLMIATNNLCLKYVSVAFYYVGRSLTNIFNVLFSFIILGEKTSKKCIFLCGVIVFGFYLGVDQESLAGSLSVSGTVFGILGSVFLSLFSIFTKKVLPKVDGEIWALSYANNVYATVLLIPLSIMNKEIGEIYYYPRLPDISFWFIIIIGGICGFAIGFFTSLQIKFTSPLTHNISGTAKACAQTVLATYWYQESKSFLWWCSNFIVLFGSAAYARVKQLELAKKHMETVMYQKV